MTNIIIPKCDVIYYRSILLVLFVEKKVICRLFVTGNFRMPPNGFIARVFPFHFFWVGWGMGTCEHFTNNCTLIIMWIYCLSTKGGREINFFLLLQRVLSIALKQEDKRVYVA